MPPKILYFDLGNVLVHFSHERQCRQIAEVAGVPVDQVRQVLYEGTLGRDSECGRVSAREAYDCLCEHLGVRPDFDMLLRANNDIFWLNVSIVPLVARLTSAGHRLGLLSNTSAAHWGFVSDGRFGGLLPSMFSPLVLSFEVGAMKPDAAIYQAAAQAAGVEPHEIFYVDDILGNVAAAREVGFDAVQYTGTPQLAADLRRRGVAFDY
jgi:putative hydrolase of the HAD superfamily